MGKIQVGDIVSGFSIKSNSLDNSNILGVILETGNHLNYSDSEHCCVMYFTRNKHLAAKHFYMKDLNKLSEQEYNSIPLIYKQLRDISLFLNAIYIDTQNQFHKRFHCTIMDIESLFGIELTIENFKNKFDFLGSFVVYFK